MPKSRIFRGRYGVYKKNTYIRHTYMYSVTLYTPFPLFDRKRMAMPLNGEKSQQPLQAYNPTSGEYYAERMAVARELLR